MHVPPSVCVALQTLLLAAAPSLVSAQQGAPAVQDFSNWDVSKTNEGMSIAAYGLGPSISVDDPFWAAIRNSSDTKAWCSYVREDLILLDISGARVHRDPGWIHHRGNAALSVLPAPNETKLYGPYHISDFYHSLRPGRYTATLTVTCPNLEFDAGPIQIEILPST